MHPQIITRDRTRPTLALLLLLMAGPAFAAVPVGSTNVQVGGFFSQGYLYSSNNNYPTADKGGTWDFREMAVNASTTVGAHLRLGAQVFAQRLGELGDDKVILDWAVADYNFTTAFGVRAGRIKFAKGLYGEALDLDIVRPFVFLPGAVYSPVLRDFGASFDGGMIYGTLGLGRGSIDYKLFYGDIPISPSKGVAEFFNTSALYAAGRGVSAMHLDSVTGGQLIWNTPASGLRFAYSYSCFRNFETDGPFAAYPPVNLHANFSPFAWHTFSVEYARDNWTLAAEWQRNGYKFTFSAPPILPVVHTKVGWDGWYVSVARRFNDRFEVGAYYGYLNDRFAALPRSAPSVHQEDLAASLRYDLNDHVLFKVEVQFLDGTYQTFNTPRIPNPPAALKNTTTVFSAKTTLSF